MVLGPNARLKIDTFVFNPDRTAQQVTINFLKGSFRFITGNSPSSAYGIRTPNMVIGMRGSALDCAVANDGRALCAALEGTITACDASNTCASFDNCTIFATTPGGSIGTINAGFDSQQTIAGYFPFINNQTGLAQGFRVDTSSCESGNPRFTQPPSDTVGDIEQPDRVFDEFRGMDRDEDDDDDGNYK
jgi:hypothetical protein